MIEQVVRCAECGLEWPVEHIFALYEDDSLECPECGPVNGEFTGRVKTDE